MPCHDPQHQHLPAQHLHLHIPALYVGELALSVLTTAAIRKACHTHTDPHKIQPRGQLLQMASAIQHRCIWYCGCNCGSKTNLSEALLTAAPPQPDCHRTHTLSQLLAIRLPHHWSSQCLQAFAFAAVQHPPALLLQQRRNQIISLTYDHRANHKLNHCSALFVGATMHWLRPGAQRETVSCHST